MSVIEDYNKNNGVDAESHDHDKSGETTQQQFLTKTMGDITTFIGFVTDKVISEHEDSQKDVEEGNRQEITIDKFVKSAKDIVYETLNKKEDIVFKLANPNYSEEKAKRLMGIYREGVSYEKAQPVFDCLTKKIKREEEIIDSIREPDG
jgi:hypothetical protein